MSQTNFDTMFSSQEKDTIRHILKHWEPRVRDFAPSVYLDHKLFAKNSKRHADVCDANSGQ